MSYYKNRYERMKIWKDSTLIGKIIDLDSNDNPVLFDHASINDEYDQKRYTFLTPKQLENYNNEEGARDKLRYLRKIFPDAFYFSNEFAAHLQKYCESFIVYELSDILDVLGMDKPIESCFIDDKTYGIDINYVKYPSKFDTNN